MRRKQRSRVVFLNPATKDCRRSYVIIVRNFGPSVKSWTPTARFFSAVHADLQKLSEGDNRGGKAITPRRISCGL